MKTLSPIKKQITKFTLIGIVAALTDLAFYYVFLNTLPEKMFVFAGNEVLSKTLSFICGIFVTYNLNKFWTWKRRERSNKRFVKFIFLYSGSLVINVSANSILLYALFQYQMIRDLPNKYLIAFIGATGLSALMNFMGQKFWVFVLNEDV